MVEKLSFLNLLNDYMNKDNILIYNIFVYTQTLIKLYVTLEP